MKELWYLGLTRNDEKVYLEEFSWDCGWYWGGGYICTAHKNVTENQVLHGQCSMHTHFDSFFKKDGMCFIDVKKSIFKTSYLSTRQWWRLADLFEQFYALKAAAGIYKHGGHQTSYGRTYAETDSEMAAKLNKQIEHVIIPEIRKLLIKVRKD